MPGLDPQIPLEVKTPPAPSLATAAQGVESFEAAQALADQRQATADLRTQQAQDRIQAAKQQSIIGTAVQQSGGDLDKALSLIQQSGDGGAIDTATKLFDAHRTAAAAYGDKVIANQQASLQHTLSLANGVTDDPTWQATRPVMIGSIQDPQLRAMADARLPKTYDQTAINNFLAIGQSQKDRLDQQAKFWDELKVGGGVPSLAGMLSTIPVANRTAALDRLTGSGLPGIAAARALVEPIIGDDAKLAALAMGPKETATVTGVVPGTTTPTEAAKKDAATAQNEAGNLAVRRGELAVRQGEAANAATLSQGLKPGTPEYRVAQDIADGSLTLQDFQRLYGRAQANAPLKVAIYDTARQLNPNFNPAQFEIGFKFASSPKVQAQIASIKNVESGIPAILDASDAAVRSGSPMLNQYVVKPVSGFVLGGKRYSNFQTAVTAFADELSGALGYGSATDMSRDMGFNMTDMNQSPAVFKSNMQDIVAPFVARKKASMIGQMGPYGAGSDTPKVVTTAELAAIAKNRGTTVDQEKARATAAGYVIR